MLLEVRMNFSDGTAIRKLEVVDLNDEGKPRKTPQVERSPAHGTNHTRTQKNAT